ncbi:MAG TPA: type III pantothenate kinase [Rhodospirillales bacterium]|nr:type III pantothenate kinase [Alphaproteobacteria bacterium]HIO02817.1 type III pantothenate kinase [Alphaproteobacteria bacterium]HIO38154.1 type III pantothenate kinase [Rhodospirillales bacterium]
MSRHLLLVVDAGNTNVVFALFDGATLLNQWRTSTDIKRTADEYGVWLTQLIALDGIKPNDINAAILATVVPHTVFPLTHLCERYFKCAPLIIDNGNSVGISVEVANPREVGADRLVNAVAAHAKFSGRLIVIDFGTATTFDIIRDDGAYVGGVIAPGVNLSIEALDRAAARLPRITVAKPPSVIGSGTVTAMQSGVYWGYISLIEGLVTRIKEEVGQSMRTISTGGLAPLFKNGTDLIDELESDLTLHGLRLVYDRRKRAEI